MSGKRSRASTELSNTNMYSDESNGSDNSDYNENEQILLSKLKRKHKNAESEDEAVFDVASDDSSESDGSNIALSDVDNGNDNEDDLPNVKAWGKDKRSYYSTDYIDRDYGGHTGKDALNANFEEEEAQNLQLQLAKQLEDEDFFFENTSKSVTNKFVPVAKVEQLIKTDTSNLTKRQQLQLLEKESPEFFNLVADFKVKILVVKKELPKEGQILKSDDLNFLGNYKDLLLNYCTNIVMYLLLKSQRVKLHSHPIIKRLLQYRQLINEMEPVYEKLCCHMINNDLVHKKISKIETRKQKKVKKPKSDNMLVAFENQVETNEKQTEENKSELENGIEEKRAITYQMKKNKGLMPPRKKEQRNPRVKHRNKFRKALIRRKGAVRQVRTEVNRYGGEASGIKASVAKSIKIK